MFSPTLEGNILKFNLYKTFSKRVFLPLIVVYLTTIAQVTLVELGIIASITAFVCLLVEIPTGYFADYVGHKKSLLIGSFLTSLSPLCYLVFPNFIGGVLGSVIFFVGVGFTQGVIQVFMYETLVELHKEKDYVKIMGNAQSYGLIGNMILIALVPLTYTIHPYFPFIIGFLCLFISFLLVLSFKEPTIQIKDTHHSFTSEVKELFRQKIVLQTFLLFIIFGISSATFNNSGMYRELVFTYFNIPVSYFGLILALGSLLAAITGKYIHHLQKIKASYFYLFDLLYIVLLFFFIAYAHHALVIVALFSLIPAYSRTRVIMFESAVFESFPTSSYKSTVLSTMNLFSLLFGIGIPLIFTYTVTAHGLLFGHAWFGVIVLLIALPFFLFFALTQKSVQNTQRILKK